PCRPDQAATGICLPRRRPVVRNVSVGRPAPRVRPGLSATDLSTGRIGADDAQAARPTAFRAAVAGPGAPAGRSGEARLAGGVGSAETGPNLKLQVPR